MRGLHQAYTCFYPQDHGTGQSKVKAERSNDRSNDTGMIFLSLLPLAQLLFPFPVHKKGEDNDTGELISSLPFQSIGMLPGIILHAAGVQIFSIQLL